MKKVGILQYLVLFILINAAIAHADTNFFSNKRKIENFYYSEKKAPQVTMLLVFDQCAYHYFPKLSHYFTDGFKTFLKRGTCYTNALHPHGIPETSPGHASLSSGLLPKDHEVVGNRWYNDQAKVTEFAEYTNQKNTTSQQISAPYPVDNITDQANMSQTFHAICVGLKKRAVIATGGHTGPCFWFDDVTGCFTSHAPYVETLPEWVDAFNKEASLNKLNHVAWPLRFNENDKAYQFPFIDDYAYAGHPDKLAGSKKIIIDYNHKTPFHLFVKTPKANELVFNFALTALKETLKKDANKRIIMWVCLSSLDLLGHIYGPDSRDVIDFLYHADKQTGNFIKKVQKLVGKKNALFVMTGDHGIQPIQEISFKKGIKTARRIMAPDLIKDINQHIAQKFNVPDVIKAFESSYFVFDRPMLATLNNEPLVRSITEEIKKYLKKIPGIKRVWDKEELKNLQVAPHSLEQFYKNQFLYDKGGDIVCQPQPYCLITNYKTGASHDTPYRYDTHVPLMFYQAGATPAKHVTDLVYTQQLVPTLATIHFGRFQKPSGATFSALPGFFLKDNQ